jgi:lipopolysaccharide export LptBFGC system permease protein LptF
MKWDNWNDFNPNDMAHELEVHIITTDGAQHLRLNGYLKRNSVLIKSETIADNKKDDIFGRFMIYPTHKQLEALKKENRKNDLYNELEIMTTEDGRWNLYKKDIQYFEGIKEFLFNISLNNPKDLTRWIEKANNISIELFKKSKSYIDEYVETNDLTASDKIKDLSLMIEHFEEQERYEDCALLMKIIKRIKRRNNKIKNMQNE